MEIQQQDQSVYDVIIVGGSYAGLSAAMTLARSIRSILIIDSGKPCNAQTPHAHNFITHDGAIPGEISKKAKQQVLQYSSVEVSDELAIEAGKDGGLFYIRTSDQRLHKSRKLLFSTGLKDLLPNIPGIAECWGKSVLHCPYCHGYEGRGEKTGLLANGDMAYHVAMLLKQLTSDLIIFTNGSAQFTSEQWNKIQTNQIQVVEMPVHKIIHHEGYLKKLVLTNDTLHELKVMYAKVNFEQHCNLPEHLGCVTDNLGLIKVDEMQKTNIEGVYAAGDNTSMGRSLSIAIAAGTRAGAALNAEICAEDF